MTDRQRIVDAINDIDHAMKEIYHYDEEETQGIDQLRCRLISQLSELDKRLADDKDSGLDGQSD